MKKCTHCKKLKILKNFGFNKKAKDGRESWCRVCTNVAIKDWQKRNKDKIKVTQKKWLKNNPIKAKEKSNKWKRNNKKRVLKYNTKYVKNRKKTDINFKILMALRARLRHVIKNKKESSRELLGCTIPFLRKYLESKFKSGMTWDNYGIKGWHIDHKVACCKFDMTKEKDRRKCFNYRNLQPLWAEENLRKGIK